MNKDIQTLIKEFVDDFAKHGIVINQEDVDTVFGLYTQKIGNLLGELKEETK